MNCLCLVMFQLWVYSWLMSKSEQLTMTNKTESQICSKPLKSTETSNSAKAVLEEIQTSSSYWRWRCLSLFYWQLPFTSLTLLSVILLMSSSLLFSSLRLMFTCFVNVSIVCVISHDFRLHYASLCRFRADRDKQFPCRVLTIYCRSS